MRLNARLPCIISDAVEVIGIGDRAGVMCGGGSTGRTLYVYP